MRFEVTAPRSIDSPPSINVVFPNGLQDNIDLMHYGRTKTTTGGCNYLGRLRTDNLSSVAVTGCLKKQGDEIEVTLLSELSKNTMFSVDFFGNTSIIKNPFERGRKCKLTYL